MLRIKKSRIVPIDLASGDTIKARVRIANPIQGMRLKHTLGKIGPPITEGLALMAEGKFEEVDVDTLSGAFEALCELMADWLYELMDVELELPDGETVLDWQGMSPEQQLDVIEHMPMVFLELMPAILGREEDADLGKSVELPTQDTQVVATPLS